MTELIQRGALIGEHDYVSEVHEHIYIYIYIYININIMSIKCNQ